MPNLSGVIAEGYQIIATEVIGSAGYGFQIDSVPPLPLNPYYCYTYPLLDDSSGVTRFSGMGRKVYRDGVIVIPPYPGAVYHIICIFSGNGIGLPWFLQW